MAAIVAAVLAVNLAVAYLGWGRGFPPFHLMLTTFTTMVLLGVVATARHPKSYATWVTTAVNGCVMFPLLRGGVRDTGISVSALYCRAPGLCALLRLLPQVSSVFPLLSNIILRKLDHPRCNDVACTECRYSLRGRAGTPR